MNTTTLHVWVVRMHQTIGWNGLSGVVLLIAAAFVAGSVWSSKSQWIPGSDLVVIEPIHPASPSIAGSPALKLFDRSDVPSLLSLVQHTAVSNGLGWPSADYRLVPATENEPAALEVRCNLKAPYPQLRSMLSQLFASIPGLTLREFSMNRASSETPEVDAKLAMVIFLNDTTTSNQTTQKATR